MEQRNEYTFTSESVGEGHPDKVCDQISDAVLDACFEQDPMSRVACETATKTGVVMLLGEITTKAFVNFDAIVRKVVNEIGYDSSEKGFDGNTCAVLSAIASQSPDIDMGVSKSMEARDGDQDQLDLEGGLVLLGRDLQDIANLARFGRRKGLQVIRGLSDGNGQQKPQDRGKTGLHRICSKIKSAGPVRPGGDRHCVFHPDAAGRPELLGGQVFPARSTPVPSG